MFGKHFASMYTGSLFGKPALVFAVWGYVIANQRPSRRDGVCMVEINPMMLAPMFSTSLAEVVAAIEVLCAPDEASRTADEDGRRLILESGNMSGPATYRVVNGPKYRAMRDEEARREQTRAAVRKHRANKDGKQGKPSKPPKAHAEAEVEEEEEADPEGESDARVRATPAPEIRSLPASEPWTEADQRELDALDPPDPEPPAIMPAKLWDAWLQTAHGGRDAGHYPRTEVLACCEVLAARGLGLDAFRAAAERWSERKVAKGGQPRFAWFAQDLATELDHPQRKGGRGAPTPVSTASDFEAEGADDFAALTAANGRQGAANHAE